MDSLVPVILNGVVVMLLCAAIVFGVRLHRRLVALQSAQSEFAALLGRLDGALVQASTTVSALKYNAARQLETSLPRPAATPTPRPTAAPAPQPIAPTTRHPAAVETIKTAPTKVEVAKLAPARRRRSAASLIAGERDSAADELMALMKKMRAAG
ncbi:MAG: hypothetical protein ACREE7_02490 [Dongiaceae bacterium]